MCVLTDTVNACIFNPPDAVLNQIAGQMPVFLIKIGHASSKPTIYQGLSLRLRCVNIHKSPFEMVCLNKVVLMIQPIRARKIF